MKLPGRIRELGAVDARRLIQAVLRLPEDAWREETLRQDRYEEHHDTESLILCFCDGWPNLRMMRGPAWDRLCPVAAPVVDEILGRGYPRGGKVVRMMAAKLKPGGRIPPHADTHPSFAIGHRIHVPLKTNDDVEFIVDGRVLALAAGHAYEIDNLRRHCVANNGGADRVHFIFDYVPPRYLHDTIKGRAADVPTTPCFTHPDAGAR